MKGVLLGVSTFAALALAGEASNHALVWRWALALASVVAVGVLLPRRPAGFDTAPASVPLLFLVAWLAASNAWPGHAYTPAAPYHAAFLLGGYLVGRRMDGPDAAPAITAALAFGAALAGLGLWQVSHGAARAQALFQTPATFGTVLNLLAVPLSANVLFGRARMWSHVAAVALSAGLFAANSRGAWLALAAGLLLVLVLTRKGGLRPERSALGRLGAIAVAGWTLSIAVPALLTWLAAGAPGPATGQAPSHSPLSAEAALSSVGRLGLYDLALHALSPSSLLTGDGYLHFFYLMEASGQSVATYESTNTTYFVHDDYLQVLLELGAPGALALLAMAMLPLWRAWRGADPAEAEPAVIVRRAGLAGALGSMSFQAAIDFPFYVPICLLLYGVGVGALEATLPMRATNLSGKRGLGAAAKWARLVLLVVAGWLLAAPFGAELAAAHADRQWRAGQGQGAAYWLAVAQTLQPADWRYAWYAGQFWYAQAVAGGNAGAAQRAEEAFRQAYEANPREVRALVGLIRVHRSLRPLLRNAASPAQLAAWAERAVTLSPGDQAARVERALVSRALAR